MSHVEEQRFSVVEDYSEHTFEKPLDPEAFFKPTQSEDFVEEHIQDEVVEGTQQPPPAAAQADQDAQEPPQIDTPTGSFEGPPADSQHLSVHSSSPPAQQQQHHLGAPEGVTRVRASSSFRGVMIPGMAAGSEVVSREGSGSGLVSSSSGSEVSSSMESSRPGSGEEPLSQQLPSLRHQTVQRLKKEYGHKRGGSEAPVSQEFMEELMKETEMAERERENQALAGGMTAEEKQEEILADLIENDQKLEEEAAAKESEKGPEAAEAQAPSTPATEARKELPPPQGVISEKGDQAPVSESGVQMKSTVEALTEEGSVPKQVESLLNSSLVHGEVPPKPVSKTEERRLLGSLWRSKLDVPVDRESLQEPLRSSKLIPPSIFNDLPAADPLADLISRQFGTQHGVKRLLLDVMDVDHNINGLKELMEANSWRAAAIHAAKLLADFEDSLLIEDVMQIFLCRIIALVKLRSFEIAYQELKALGNLDGPEFFYEHYPETFPETRGSMVPFSIRVLAASLPHQLGKTADALDQLAQLQVHLRGILAALQKDPAPISPDLKEVAREVWEKREAKLSLMIVNHLYHLKDFQLATQVMQGIVARHPENVVYQSALGRLHLQLGNVVEAKHVFLHLRASHQGDPKYQVLIGVNDGYLHLATGSVKHALESFEKVQKDANGQLVFVAASNVAICHLYLGHLRQAIAALEGLLQVQPEKHLSEALIFNLCTLYELESDHHAEKKKYLMKLAAAHLGDHFNIECLKFGNP